MVNITYVDLLRLANSFDYANSLNSITNASTDHVSLLAYHQSFVNDVIGTNSTQKLIAELPFDAFHEAGVYNQATGKIYATSNWAGSLDNPINVTIIDPKTGDISFTRYDNVAEANGAAAFYPVGTPANSSEGQQIVFCDQGDINHHRSQLTVVNPATNETKVILDNFLGRNFSSLNDVIQHPIAGDLWFNDARYAYWQNFGLEPSIRPHVYRFEPNTGVIQAVADSYIAPNGIEFSPDYKYVYVTDTGAQTFADGENNATYPATIYRFDITPDGKRLENRQMFAYSSVGLPDGIHTDIKGNVYSAVSDGIHVWNKEGVLIGRFGVGGKGVNNFIFAPGGIYIMNAYKLWYDPSYQSKNS
ncbi:Gluconolactonase [Pseudocercospora fuligena]|uniref:Gluconolactonase n=1 Tax=Pseudocercospora fuligena TaxID=685502 RepID=A0A8H6VI11_9PEZI|nr:Gluconolactonase [Pseudocercospora fuligena]